MILQQTVIADVVDDNINQSKLMLANNVIENVYPLFDEVYQERRH